MDPEIIVALIGLVGTFVGAFLGGSMALKIAMAKVETRIEMLEKKVDRHNNIIERTYKLEAQMQNITHEVDELEHKS